MSNKKNNKVFTGWYEIGSKKFPKYKYVDLKPRPIIHSENLWQEKTWEARRDESGQCYFEFLSAWHGGGTIAYKITEEEFESIKSGDLNFEDLLRLTEQNEDRLPLPKIKKNRIKGL